MSISLVAIFLASQLHADEQATLKLELYARDIAIPPGSSSAVVVRVENDSDSVLTLHPFVALRVFSINEKGDRTEATYLGAPNTRASTTNPTGLQTIIPGANAGSEWAELPRLVLQVEVTSNAKLKELWVPAIRGTPVRELIVPAHGQFFRAVQLPSWCLVGSRMRVVASLEAASGEVWATSNIHVLCSGEE